MEELMGILQVLAQDIRVVRDCGESFTGVAAQLGVHIAQLNEIAVALDEQYYQTIIDAAEGVKRMAIPLIKAVHSNDHRQIAPLNTTLAIKVKELHELVKTAQNSEQVPSPIPIEEAKAIIAEDIKQTIYDLDQAYKRADMSKTEQLMKALAVQCKKVCSYGANRDLDPEPITLISEPLTKVATARNKPDNQDELQEALKGVHRGLKQILTKYSSYNDKLGGKKKKTKRMEKEMKMLNDNLEKGDPTQLFDLVKELGKGASGYVYKAVSKDDNAVYAIKKVPLSFKTLLATVKEIKFMRGIQHQNTLRYYKCYHKNNDVWIVMEICEVGSVLDILKKTETGLEEKYITAITAQVLKGLDYLHTEAKTIHRDIKSANLLMNSKAEVKIADYGTAAEADVQRTTVIGSSYWMAPETIDQQGYDAKADIWSLGITLIEMAEKDPPYFNLEPHELVRAIVHHSPPTLKDPTKWSANFKDFVRNCLQRDPKRRYSAAMLLEHPWIKSADGSSLVELVDKFQKSLPPESDGHPRRASLTRASLPAADGSLKPKKKITTKSKSTGVLNNNNIIKRYNDGTQAPIAESEGDGTSSTETTGSTGGRTISKSGSREGRRSLKRPGNEIEKGTSNL